VLGQAAMADSHKAALSCCRLLSRDKTHLSECVTDEQVGQLMQLSGLTSPDGRLEDPAARLEAKKVLSNLVHQSTVLQTYAIQRGIVPAALRLVSEHRCNNAPGGDDDPESRRFDFRLLFLVTALCPDQRTIARNQHSALGRQPNTSGWKRKAGSVTAFPSVCLFVI
jgi:hypothetical protein